MKQKLVVYQVHTKRHLVWESPIEILLEEKSAQTLFKDGFSIKSFSQSMLLDDEFPVLYITVLWEKPETHP